MWAKGTTSDLSEITWTRVAYIYEYMLTEHAIVL